MKDMLPEDIQKPIVLNILKEEESEEAPLTVLPYCLWFWSYN